MFDLDQICGSWKDEYVAASTTDPVQNIKLDTKGEKIQFLNYLNGQSGCYTYDWKRLLRNIEFDNADINDIHERYGDIDNMIACLDCSEDDLGAIGLKMLQELENVKDGKICWAQLRTALERITRTDCADAFEKWCIDIGKFIRNKIRKSFKRIIFF